MCSPTSRMARRERAARHPAVTELVAILKALEDVNDRVTAWLDSHDVGDDYTPGLRALDTLAKSSPRSYDVTPDIVPALRALSWNLEAGHSMIESEIPGGFGLSDAA